MTVTDEVGFGVKSSKKVFIMNCSFCERGPVSHENMHFREENKFRVIFENVNEKWSENVRENLKF